LNVLRDESFSFSSYNLEYLVCRREVSLTFDSNIELKSKMNQILPLHTLTCFILSCFSMSNSNMSASANMSSSSVIPTKISVRVSDFSLSLSLSLYIYIYIYIYMYSVYIFFSPPYMYQVTNISNPRFFYQLNRTDLATPGYWIFVPFSHLLKKIMIIIVIMATTKAAGSAEICLNVNAKSKFMHFFLLVLCFIF